MQSAVLSSSIPSLVIAQFQERFYPRARVVPNIIPQNDLLYKPEIQNPLYDICFSPTSLISAWDDRWNTKGNIEVHQILKSLQREKITFTYLSGVPLTQVIDLLHKY